MYREVFKCRICGNPDLETVLDLGTQALTGVFPSNREMHVAEGPLELVKCRDNNFHEACGLVQLRHSFESTALYGMNYGYRSGLNRSMVTHLQDLACKIKSFAPLVSGDLVLDIGSNDSTLLQAMHEPGLRLVGMDPTGVKFQRHYPAYVHLIPDFFSADRFRSNLGRDRARVVTSIAMFYDLESPLDFMRQVCEVLATDGLWVFEQSYLPTMLLRNSYDTICHEHVEYYAFKQILWMAERAGLKILDVELNDVNGGSFRVFASRLEAPYFPNHIKLSKMLRDEEEAGLGRSTIYSEFRDRVFRHRDELRRFFQAARGRGENILGYGASTKGNVILQFCGLTTEDLASIAEVNEDKFGSFTPGSLIPIISETEARAKNPAAFFVLPWHFRRTIIDRENQFLCAGGKLIFPLPGLEIV